ncbi:MAG: isochorismatase family protein [Pseudomonadaceae bacterium]|jgi:nicotinamidase-related amidase|nr:isochorismatase family protein [Pseudomonadaceae bacterium]
MTKAATLKHCALLVIDMQAGLTPGAYRIDEVIENTNAVSAHLHQQGGHVFYIQHCHKSFSALQKGNPGWEIDPRLTRRDDDQLIEKEASDAFYNTQLASLLTAAKVSHVYITGMQTEFCVDTTCRAALNYVEQVTLVSDAHTTGDGTLSAADTIHYHNTVLANVAHPRGNINVILARNLIG